jgi:hypothetical protein
MQDKKLYICGKKWKKDHNFHGASYKNKNLNYRRAHVLFT